MQALSQLSYGPTGASPEGAVRTETFGALRVWRVHTEACREDQAANRRRRHSAVMPDGKAGLAQGFGSSGRSLYPPQQTLRPPMICLRGSREHFRAGWQLIVPGHSPVETLRRHPWRHCPSGTALEPDSKLYEWQQDLARRLVRMRRLATKIQASALAMVLSQSLARRRQRPSQANVRSTTHRRGKTSKPLA